MASWTIWGALIRVDSRHCKLSLKTGRGDEQKAVHRQMPPLLNYGTFKSNCWTFACWLNINRAACYLSHNSISCVHVQQHVIFYWSRKFALFFLFYCVVFFSLSLAYESSLGSHVRCLFGRPSLRVSYVSQLCEIVIVKFMPMIAAKIIVHWYFPAPN